MASNTNLYRVPPQGGIISPLLANVYLHYIDLRIDELIKKGKPIRTINPEYKKIWNKNQHHKLRVDSSINLNPKPRIEYIRYADDFIIGVKGEYDKTEKVKNQLTRWLEQDLKITISKDKSKIVKTNKGTRFLSYMIKVNPTNKTRKEKTTRNSLNGNVQIQIHQAKTEEYGDEYNWLKKGKTKHDETLADRDELENNPDLSNNCLKYFCLANNLGVLNYLAEDNYWKTKNVDCQSSKET
ncbi:reverse transcriptase/maturase family protein ['Crotalaria aegyptiaca' phytoplasma]|uniref:Reverse transcriptase/maturase family protein n=1 Tax=Candidatus Phytoplasma crotalariae TaxID=2982627 RepID=A0ABT9D2K7_9MOLU|nr:reverse transcriptase/maturase family protein ['Crotalaria aegyptiaca' phytoplasma]MDO8059249.1 reverse transcriptase/maturase family protein ['Crotalaria aegyptiaca' phytoplasma]